ncbi:DUF1848 family protein [Paenibacillus monticola]|uniref:DUF1848 family protein n=1 Tax=Paenibacillus monticola TaxID=2666075 RepID=A0A7X2H8W8_9BACL|nr:DUF1848 family protein [Paenibacillus monticola]MRN55008.1 DUF1848 family protein [Paenibacillus monticola]
MIISASTRTDIPSFYSKWFMNRLKDGEVLVKNPRNPCSETIDLSQFKITHAACFDQGMVEKIIDCPIKVKRRESTCGLRMHREAWILEVMKVAPTAVFIATAQQKTTSIDW